jgi:hydrogenase maturation protein HypF
VADEEEWNFCRVLVVSVRKSANFAARSLIDGPVAQWIEHLPSKQAATGSTPVGITVLKMGHHHFGDGPFFLAIRCYFCRIRFSHVPQSVLQTYHLHLLGQVQGVGFRPFVWRMARAQGLCGWVNNTTDGVHVIFNAVAGEAEAFVQALLRDAPALSIITDHTLEIIELQSFPDFQIVHSAGDAEPNLLLTPDFGLCDDCRRELLEPANRRRQYPFITCTNCGPRFSIVTGLPYDRERTTMSPFHQCPDCAAEYADPADRRYYSQTNSCATCGIALRLVDTGGREWENPLKTTITWLQGGKILAVKGIGGYLLLCDATNPETLALLRRRKRRPSKPLALLYPGIPELDGDARLNEKEKTLLQSPAAPIVLAPMQERPASGLCAALVAPGLEQIGVMLPYTPLLELIARGVGKPLVVTSGNISGSPILYEDEKALHELSPIADGLLMNNRNIAIPQDDSVIRFSPVHGQKIVLRRSRGYAPTFLFETAPPELQTSNFKPQTSNSELQTLNFKLQTPNFKPQTSNSILALGATLKSTFSWQYRGNLYISQYLGDLDSFDTQEAYEHTLHHFLGLFRHRPKAIVVDKHPNYFSTRLGKQLAIDWQIPIRETQHHKAHFAAVLAENGYFSDLKNLELPVLGVIWDGTGYGDDGQVWGGDFFYFDRQKIERVGHFEPFSFLLGDKMPREPRISALSLTQGLEGSAALLESKFSPQEWALYGKMLSRGTPLQTTSVGRLFDGVASLLGLANRVSYEGEAAMLLEQSAARYFRQHGLKPFDIVLPEAAEAHLAPTKSIVRQIMWQVQHGTPPEQTAAYFHAALIEIIRRQARLQGCRVLAFSGGVWQNALLVDLALEWLRPEFELLFHRQLSPNDEGVSFGQLFMDLKWPYQ